MPRYKEYNREAVLDSATEVFWKKGYVGSAMSDLVNATALNKHSMYKEFGSKEGLFLACIENFANEINKEAAEIIRRRPLGLQNIIDEIANTVIDYRAAALNAKEAGFSGVEIHSANGYLLNQFLDSKTNLRDNLYGGTPENKYRFLGEVLAAVLEVWPSERVCVRLSPNGVFNDMGSEDFRETYLYTIKELNKLNLGYVYIMDGLAFGFHEKGEPMTLAEFREHYDGVIIGNCEYTKEDAEQRIKPILWPLVVLSSLTLIWWNRWQNGWELEPFEDMSLCYAKGAEGYTDYTPYSG